MRIENPLHMNDWKIKKFLTLIFLIQIVEWILIVFEEINLHIPILRQIIGFIYLTFVPGILILRILKLHKLSNIEALLYSVALSVATLIFTVLCMNMAYPLFGVSNPISLLPLIVTISAVISMLCILCYVRDKDFSNPSFIEINDLFSSQSLILYLIPFLGIFGPFLMTIYNFNMLQMTLIIIVAILPVLVAFDKLIVKDLYPVAVSAVALSLLLHRSLMGQYLWGGDVLVEYYFANKVITNSIWDPTIPSNANVALSVTILPSIFSKIIALDLAWFFKFVCPLLFSLAPLGLYRVFQKQVGDKIAFLACFFFMSNSGFYHTMPTVARQEIATLFLVSLLLVIVNNRITASARALLIIVFAFSTIVSHYALSALYVLIFILSWLIFLICQASKIRGLIGNFRFKFNERKEKHISNSSLLERRTISLNFVLFYTISMLSWSMYVGGGQVFDVITIFSGKIIKSFFTEFGSPEKVQAIYLLTLKLSWVESGLKVVHLISQFFIAVGILRVLLKCEDVEFSKDYCALSVANSIVFIFAIFTPYFGATMQTVRIYDILLLVLAPFCILGGATVFKIGNRIRQGVLKYKKADFPLKILSLFVVVFLLINSGWLNVVVKENPLPYRAFAMDNSIDFPLFNEREMFGVRWLLTSRVNYPIYADGWRVGLIYQFALGDGRSLSENARLTSPDSYIFLGTWNIMKSEILIIGFFGVNPVYNYTNLKDYISNRSKVYDNGGAQIWGPE